MNQKKVHPPDLLCARAEAMNQTAAAARLPWCARAADIGRNPIYIYAEKIRQTIDMKGEKVYIYS